MSIPIELRPLRAILSNLAIKQRHEEIGTTIAEWARREGLELSPFLCVADATVVVSAAFLSRAALLAPWPSPQFLALPRQPRLAAKPGAALRE